MNIELIYTSLPKIISGLDDTILLTFYSLSIGFILAIFITLAQLCHNKIIRTIAIIYIYIFRSTPLLIQIFLVYYGSGQFREFFESIGLWVFFRDAWFCAIFTLTLNTSAYTSQILRGGIESVPIGSIEAAQSVGMSRFQIFKRITFPSAMRISLPAYGNEIILMVKSTSLASTITIMEITGIAKKIIATTYQPIEVFVLAGAVYLTLNFILTRLIYAFEKRLTHYRQ